MIVDGQLIFEPLAGTAITTTAASTNVLDLGVGSSYNQGRDLGGAYAPGSNLVVSVLTSFTSGGTGTTLNVQVQGAPDNGSGGIGVYQTYFETGITYLGQLTSGFQLLRTLMASVAQPIIKPVNTTFTCAASATTITVSSATGIQFGQELYSTSLGAYFTPGTTVTGISGTTITISNATLAAASTATAISFFAAYPTPRYLRLNYVVASGPFTGGSLWGGIVLDQDRVPLYAPGFAFPAGT